MTGFLFFIFILIIEAGLLLFAFLRHRPGMQEEFRDSEAGLADLLRHAEPIADGVLSGKGGEIIGGFFYRGTDTESSTNHELDMISARVNNALARLGSGWMAHIDAMRSEAIGYPDRTPFVHPVAELVDEERRLQYSGEGLHHESRYAIILTYLPPLAAESKAQSMMFEHSEDLRGIKTATREKLVAQFNTILDSLEGELGLVFNAITRMRCHERTNAADGRKYQVDDLLGYVHYCVTGIAQYMALPKAGVTVDTIVGSQDFVAGNTPKVGANHIRILSIEGFPSHGYSGILDSLNSLPVTYRWSTRFIFMDPEEGRNLLEKMFKKWRQKIRGLRDTVSNNSAGAVDQDALEMMIDAQTAMGEAAAGRVRFGHYTSVIVLMNQDLPALLEAVEMCAKAIRTLSFAVRVETINAVEAFLGSIPGHGYENVRRPILHTMNLAHLIPTTATWPGLSTNPNPFYPPNSPPLMYADTTGGTPFRVGTHVGDVGHFLMLGPTGAGKSTLLELMGLQHMRYRRARTIKFEKGYSSYVACASVNGAYYDLAGEHPSIVGGKEYRDALCPLRHVDQPSWRLWALDWIETCLALSKVEVTSRRRNLIANALVSIGNADPDQRTMTHFVSQLQDSDLQEALKPYTLAGNNQMLDGEDDTLQGAHFIVFEMEHLMGKGAQIAVPVLLYLFRKVETMLDGSPTLLILDEAWLMLEHPIFSAKIKEWLKVMRKRNCSVGFATQSISDVGKSSIRDVLYESCPTKIFLSNPEAQRNVSVREEYERIGLNDQQIELIAQGVKKQDYFYMSPLGRRRFRLGLGPVTLAFVGVSGTEDIDHARRILASGTRNFGAEWLRHCSTAKVEWGDGLAEWASLLENRQAAA
ncbi:transporter [Cupriavidus basilensis]|uniref:Transporter n=1 Tax=Cupriavidus basilensis TaxID=68895 RepID=A0A643FSZ6_9BURK|nr:transporter [Cupriavidus basilensis]QOT82251.1 transporter [Cupriavidus basilensis]